MTASNLADGLGLKNIEIEINYLASEFLSRNLFSQNPLPILELKKALTKDSEMKKFKKKYMINHKIKDNK